MHARAGGAVTVQAALPAGGAARLGASRYLRLVSRHLRQRDPQGDRGLRAGSIWNCDQWYDSEIRVFGTYMYVLRLVCTEYIQVRNAEMVHTSMYWYVTVLSM